MSISVAIGAIIKMLDNCARGYSIRVAEHNRRVTYKNKIYPSLPKHDNIELGFVKQMVRVLEIDKECANAHFKVKLFKIEKSESKAEAASPQSRPPN